MTAAGDRGDAATVDALVVGAHPDDAEIGCAGAMLRMTDAGLRVAVVDCTRGESASRGTPALRAEEAARAAALLGLCARQNLGLPDGRVADDEAALRALVGALRRLRPRLLLAPFPIDAHPDHEAVAAACRRAFFHAGLRNLLPELGPPWRPRALLRYAGNDGAVPTFCVDIDVLVDRKRAVLECYASQIGRSPDERAHYLRGADHVERALVRDRYYGTLCGCGHAEPFWTDGPFALDALAPLVTAGAGVDRATTPPPGGNPP